MGWALSFGGQAWEHTFPNELAAVACFSRAFSNVKAATALTVSGYYAEVEPLLRSAYEAASLGRMLATEGETAERWLREGEWVPDRRVRSWIGDQRGEDQQVAFAAHYKAVCDETHPTADAALRSVITDDSSWRARLRVEPQSDAVAALLDQCMASAAFVGLCL